MINTTEINKAIAARAARIKLERESSPSHLAKARAQILKNLQNIDKEQLEKLTKSTNLIDLQTYLHSFTDLTTDAIDSFLALVKSPATTDSFEEFCKTWGIH